jgi:multiple sugar transport system substrate-binding protein
VYLLAVENKIHQLDVWMMDHKLNKNDYYPAAFTSIAIEGYQFCLNPAGGANCVYYNSDLFDKAGIKAPTSWAKALSWEEFWDNVRKLTKRSGDKTDVYALGFPANISTPTGYGNGATAFSDDETRCGFNTPAVHEVIDPFVKGVREGLVAPPDLDRLELFNAGRLAMTWESMGFDQRISRTIKWDLMPWPKTKKFAMSENYDRTFVIAKSAKDAEAAFLGLKALCEKEASDVWATYRFGIPYLKASAEGPLLNDPNKPPAHKNVWFETFGNVGDAPVDVPTPRGPVGEEWKEAFTSELFTSALSGQISTQQFLDQACQRVDNEIAKRQWRKGRGMELLQKGGGLTEPSRRFLTGAR